MNSPVRPIGLGSIAILALAVTAISATSRAANGPPAPTADNCADLAGLQIAAAVTSETAQGPKVEPTIFESIQGAVIEMAAHHDKDRLGAAVPFCAVAGRIGPNDPKAPPIRFQLNLPDKWNGKALQFGGGGYNGRIPDSTGMQSHGLRNGPTPLARGYLTFSDDSGHQSRTADDAMFAENDEALANFGALHIRKARDVMVEVAKRRYGNAPKRIYFAGGSTGGREALTAALRWPDLYDGVIANYPTANFLGLRMQNAAITRSIYENGSVGWIPPEMVKKMAAEGLAECDKLDGAADGIVSNMTACHAGAEARLRRWSCPNSPPPCLSAAQVATVKRYHEGHTTTWQPQDSTNGFKGYNILEGVAMDLGNQPEYRLPLKDGDNAHAAVRADEFLKHFVARDEKFDVLHFDVQAPGALTERLKLISQLIGATSTDYTRFVAHGGKVLLMHGTEDVSVSPHDNIRRYQAIAAAMGAKTSEFLRFYLVPGQGHGIGTFRATWDNLEVLDAWVDRGVAPPVTPVAYDGNEGAKRSRPLCEWPKWPRYEGKGDVDEAGSFRCAE